MPVVREIRIHPIKALDAVSVPRARVLASGGLELDRRFAFRDAAGRFINGKNREAVHRLRAEYDLARLEVALAGRVFSLERQRPEIEAWVSEWLNEPVTLADDAALGFPDDTDASGPTFVSEASLVCVAGWFELSVQSARARFRANVEIGDVAAFWEDRLYGKTFHAGPVSVYATNACQRCVVPTRDPLTGEPIAGFQKRFTELRRESLPAEADPAFFNHHYRFAVNTRIAPSEAGKFIAIGDPVVFEP